mmetsp:Transcript_51600/g.95498  ORF Transcript_51600/g.95498 Transcript_51600/m.95498 type:complete len:752 (+) Transcript_51600:78-2333(+)
MSLKESTPSKLSLHWLCFLIVTSCRAEDSLCPLSISVDEPLSLFQRAVSLIPRENLTVNFTDAGTYHADPGSGWPAGLVANKELSPSVPADATAETVEVKPHAVARRYEPQGIVSNVYGGDVVWWLLDSLSYRRLMPISFLCYPVIFVGCLALVTIVLSVSLQPASQGSEEVSRSGMKMLPASELGDYSKCVYSYWRTFCYFIPLLLTLGTCVSVFICLWVQQNETYLVLMTLSSFFFFSISVHQIGFMPWLLMNIRRMDRAKPEDLVSSNPESLDRHVQHWVIVPNYKEDLDTLRESLGSIAKSTLAQKQIGIVLAMEKREDGSEEKAEKLKGEFKDNFCEIIPTFHPPDLPNDPAGKASNVAWAFKRLTEHLKTDGSEKAWEPETEDGSNGATMAKSIACPPETSAEHHVVLTVADADSCFHELYFEALTKDYVELSEEQRQTSMWQAPIYHMKNYHDQPSPVAVGSIFTGMIEGAMLADPNAIKFPYSTYSVSYAMAQSVGGWDAEWIAEDWHMGIKCYLLTLARMEIRTIYAPIVNTTPEAPDGNWMGTLWARLSQAKRHALGFSDIAYLFMMLPLLVQYLLRVDSFDENISHFPRILLKSLLCCIRLVNTHVFLGVLAIYGVVTLFMGLTMEQGILSHGAGLAMVFSGASVMLLGVTTFIFTLVYATIKKRLDAHDAKFESLYSSHAVHFLYAFGICLCVGPIFFAALAYCAWAAAIQCARTAGSAGGFEYEVAPKPKARQTDAIV